jgi:acyl-CoA thioester hydrolase
MADMDVARLHFSAPARWMDRAFCAWLIEVGQPLSTLLEGGLGVPIVDLRCRFLARVGLDDVLDVTARLAEVGATSFRTRYEFARAGEPIVEGELVHVCVDRATGQPTSAPAWLREQLGASTAGGG